MQPALTFFGLDPLSLESLAMVGACLLVALLVVCCLPGRRRLVNPRNFSRLIEHVHDRREQLFLRHTPRVWPSAARAQFLESVRERLRDCDIFKRDSSHPLIGM